MEPWNKIIASCGISLACSLGSSMQQMMMSKPWCVQVPEECPAEIEQLIDMCLATEPADRPTAKQAFDIISSCSSHLPAVAPPPPTPIPLQQAAASADNPESCVEMPAVETVDTGGIPMGSLDDQSRQSLSHCRQSFSQQSSAASCRDHSADAHVMGHKQPLHGQTAPQHAFHQSQTAGTSSANALMGPGQDLEWPEGHQSPVQQQQRGVTNSMYSLAGSGNAPTRATVPTHLANGSQGALPLGVFGHLYPSPFDMADDESDGSSWGWQTRQAVSGVPADSAILGPQQ